jgi:hypothetical protein
LSPRRRAGGILHRTVANARMQPLLAIAALRENNPTTTIQLIFQDFP